MLHPYSCLSIVSGLHATAVMLLSLLVAFPSEAEAQGRRRRVESEADALIAEGVARRRAGDDEAALAFFANAYVLDPSPRARAQMALAEQALGRFELAEEHMLEALDEDDHPWIVENRGTLEEALVMIREARAREAATLAPSAPAAPPVARAPVRPRRVAEPPPPDHAPRRRAGTILAISGGGLVGTSVIAYSVREHNARVFNGESCLVGDASRGETCGDRHERAQRAQRVAAVTLGVGTTLLATGLVLRFVHPERSEDARASARPVCTAGIAQGVEGGCTWHF